MKSSWLRYPPVVLFSLRKEVSSYLLQFPTLSVTFTGGDLTWLPDTDACMIPVLLFTLQLSSTKTGGGPRAVTAHAVVPTMGYKIYVAIGTIKNLKGLHFPLWPWDSALRHWRQNVNCMENRGLLPCVDIWLFDSSPSGNSSPLATFGNIKIP